MRICGRRTPWLHYQDETHLDTNPYLSRVWHRIGVQPTVPAAGTNRRLTCFGSVEAFGRGRVEVLCAAQDSAAFLRYLDALEVRFLATERKIFLVLDNGPCHTSKASRAAMTARADWLQVLFLAPYCPNLNPKEREWRFLKRDVRSHLARTLRHFADELLVGLARLGGDRCDIIDAVPQWFLDGHRRPPHEASSAYLARVHDRAREPTVVADHLYVGRHVLAVQHSGELDGDDGLVLAIVRADERDARIQEQIASGEARVEVLFPAGPVSDGSGLTIDAVEVLEESVVGLEGAG